MKTFSNNFKLAVCAAMMTAAIFTACKKDEVVVTPPDPIGGFNNSNEVGGTNLKAHWTFDGSNNEVISSSAPTTSLRSSFVTGVKGQALNLDSGFVLYPSIAALNSLTAGSVTVSCWIKTSNNGSKATNVFGLARTIAKQNDWNTGSVLVYLENGKPLSYNDTLVLHSGFRTFPYGPDSTSFYGDNINDYGVRETDFKTVKGAGKWVHYVMRYDGAGSNIDIFADGIMVSNKNFRYRTMGAPAVGLGSFVAASPALVIIGAFPNAACGFTNSAIQGWQGFYTGGIDELRYFSTALSDANISALYQLEKAGR